MSRCRCLWLPDSLLVYYSTLVCHYTTLPLSASAPLPLWYSTSAVLRWSAFLPLPLSAPPLPTMGGTLSKLVSAEYLGSLMSFLKSEKCSGTVQAWYYMNWIVPISSVWFGRFGLVWCSLVASLYLGSLMSFLKSENCSDIVQAMYYRNWIVPISSYYIHCAVRETGKILYNDSGNAPQ